MKSEEVETSTNPIDSLGNQVKQMSGFAAIELSELLNNKGTRLMEPTTVQSTGRR